MNFRRLKTWLKEILSWAWEARLSYLCFIVLMLAFLFGFGMCPSEQSIRTSGYVLQILGMIFAIRGLLRIRAHFGQPKLRSSSFAWLKRFPKWKKHYVINAEAGDYVILSGKARVELWTNDNSADPLEKRIDGIVNNLERLKEEQRKNSEQIDELQENHEKYKKEQKHKRVNMVNQFRSDLESLHTDDIVVSLIGLTWLTFGLSMSTMSQELSKIFQ